MRTALFLIEAPNWRDAFNVPAGACWYAVKGGDGEWYLLDGCRRIDRIRLAVEHRGKRPMVVSLGPDGVHCLHQAEFTSNGWGERGWEVTGELPFVTVKPSLNLGGGFWHGWITDGVMT